VGDSSLQGCYAISMGKEVPTLERSFHLKGQANQEPFLDCLNLKMKVLRTPETSVTVYQWTQPKRSDDLNLIFKTGYKKARNYKRALHYVHLNFTGLSKQRFSSLSCDTA
jgi:hypothetical protein